MGKIVGFIPEPKQQAKEQDKKPAPKPVKKPDATEK